MEAYKHQDSGISLKEILFNINIGTYQIQNADNLRIICPRFPDKVILTSEVDTFDNIWKFLSKNINVDKEKLTYEETFFDFYVVDVINKSETISLLEIIIASEFLNLEENDKWSLNDTDFILIEDNFDISLVDNISFLNDAKDLKIFG